MGSAVVSASLVLSACDMMTEAPSSEDTAPSSASEAVITSSFRTQSPLAELAFLPNSETPWTGYLVGGTSGGGFDVFNIEGESLLTASGPRLEGLAGISDFALRGESFPILFGIDSDSALRSFVVVEQSEAVLEIPLDAGQSSGWASSCLYDSGIGYVDLALLGTESDGAIVRVSDSGGVGLDVEIRAQLDFPFPARDCVVANGDVIISGPNAGLARITPDSEVVAVQRGLSVFDVTYTELFGRPAVITAEPGTSALNIYDAETMRALATLETTGGLSTAGFERPFVLASTLDSYGGMAFSTGLIAGYDREDGSVKLLARDVVSRAVLAPADTTG